jgi:DNA invertase Pin-like site-specific DNA recombinase
MRVIGRIRLSRLTEESTSAARQRDVIEQWATSNGHEVIGWAEDLDVSGSVDPFDTPALGPWLTPEKAREWDVLCAWKLDRLGRNSIRLNKLFGWAIDNGKTVVSCSEGIDLSTPVGRLIANVIAFLAEGELEAIKERTKASRRKLLESGRWPGGIVRYGHRPVEIPGGGWRLELHPDEAPVLRNIIADVLAGKSIVGVAEKYRMSAPTLWDTLASKQLMGHATYEGNTVRDTQGNPVLNADPVLSVTEWGKLQQALQARRQGPKRTTGTSPLLGVVKCFDCGRNLVHKVYRRDYGKQLYRYYHCSVKGHCGQVSAETVEETLKEVFLDTVGDENVLEKVFVPAESHQIELDEAVRAVDELTALLGTMTSDTMRKRLTGQLEAIDFRIAALEKLPTRQSGWELKDTGSTFKSMWENSDKEERRQLLLRSGITFKIKRVPDTQAFHTEMYIPDEILERLNAKKPLTHKG